MIIAKNKLHLTNIVIDFLQFCFKIKVLAIIFFLFSWISIDESQQAPDFKVISPKIE